VDFTQGAFQTTGSKTNFALQGDGFFTVQTAAGPAYTRDGAFAVSPDGYLATLSGNKVLGNAGPIKVGKGDISVNDSGIVSQNGATLDTLKIARFANQGALTKIGGNLFSAGGAVPTVAKGTVVRQGYLEASNVNSVSEMVSMISAYRTFEASSKAVQAADSTLDKCVNEVGRVS
jgi:flagellar basal-body rod protein FlgG